MDYGFGFGHGLWGVLPALLWLLMTVGLVVAVVLGLRAMLSIDRSLKELAAQGRGRATPPMPPAAAPPAAPGPPVQPAP